MIRLPWIQFKALTSHFSLPQKTLAFSTIQGSGGAPDSFVGTAGVDPITLVNTLGNFILTGVGDSDLVDFVGSGNAPAVTDATLKGGDGADDFNDVTGEVFTSVDINGNAGDDTLNFGASIFTNSMIRGGKDDDLIDVSFLTGSLINGNKGDDTIEVVDVITSDVFGGQGDDDILVSGTVSLSAIAGDAGNDDITFTSTGIATVSNSTVTGGDGNDLVIFNTVQDITISNISFDLGDGNNTLNANDADVLLGAGIDVTGGSGIDVVNFFAALADTGNTAGVTVDGGAGADQLTGSVLADSLVGGDGDDAIAGTNGNDIITGGAGADTLTAGLGSVDFVYDSVADSAASTATNATRTFDVITDFGNGADDLDIAAINTVLTGGGAATGVFVTDLGDLGSVANFAALAADSDLDAGSLLASAAGAAGAGAGTGIKAYTFIANIGSAGSLNYTLINNNDTAYGAADVLIQTTGALLTAGANTDFILA